MSEEPTVSPAATPNLLMALIQGSTAIPKSVAKLVDTVGYQIGLYCEPHHIRAIAEAKADAKLIDAKNQAAIQVIKADGKFVIRDIEDRAAERARLNQERQQRNIESIAGKAAEELQSTVSDVSDVPVDPDWTTRFFEKCQGVSDEQMQLLWAKLLAGETVQPGAFSRKTLSIVDVMSKEQAVLFTRLCSTVWTIGSVLRPLIFGVVPPRYELSAGLTFEDLVNLDALGLVSFSGVGGYSVRTDSPDLPCVYFRKLHLVRHSDPNPGSKQYSVGKVMFTDAGRQLWSIAGPSLNEAYRQAVVEEFGRQNVIVSEYS